MNKRNYILFLIIVFPLIAFGQIDVKSVRELLQNENSTKGKVKVYEGFIAGLSNSNFEEDNILLIKEGLLFAQKTKQPDLEGNLLLKLAELYLHKGEFKESINFGLEAKTFFEERNNKNKLGETLYYLAYDYTLLKDYKTAYLYLNKGMKMAYQLKNLQLQGQFLMVFGDYYHLQEAYETEIDTFKIALDRFEKAKSIEDIFWVRKRLITRYRAINKIDLSEKVAVKNLALATSEKDNINIAYSCNELGGIYAYTERYDLAKRYYLKAVALYTSLKDTVHLEYSVYNLGQLHLTIGDLEKAFKYYQQSLALVKTMDNPHDILWADASVGIIYYEMGEYPKALKRFQAFVESCKKEGDIVNELQFYYWIAKVQMKLGEFQKAQFYIQKVIDNYQVESVNYDDLIFVETLVLNSTAYLKQQQTEKAAIELEKALDYAKLHKVSSALSNVYIAFGELNTNRKNYQAALNNYQKALATANKFGLKKERIDIYYNIASCYRYLKQYNLSIDNLKQSEGKRT